VVAIDLKRWKIGSVALVECASLFENAFALPGQGRAPVPTARPAQGSDEGFIEALVG
jgi:hypothetical protein